MKSPQNEPPGQHVPPKDGTWAQPQTIIIAASVLLHSHKSGAPVTPQQHATRHMDIKNFYLNTPLDIFEYLRMPPLDDQIKCIQEIAGTFCTTPGQSTQR